MTAVTPFQQGYDDAYSQTTHIMKAAPNTNRGIDRVSREAERAVGALLTTAQYQAGRLKCWAEGQLDVAPELVSHTAKQLRAIADQLEAK